MKKRTKLTLSDLRISSVVTSLALLDVKAKQIYTGKPGTFCACTHHCKPGAE